MTITAEGPTPLIGALQYNDVNSSGTARWATDYNGQFPSGQPRLTEQGIVSSGFFPDYGRPLYRLSAVGIDRNSRLLVSATAPAAATIVSPITSLIDLTGSQSSVRVALQMDSGAYAVPASVDLTLVSGFNTSTGPILAANVRALMLSQAVYVASRGIGALDYIPFNLQSREQQIAAFIKGNPSTSLLTEAGAEQLLRAYGDRTISDAAYRAMAHLVKIYADAATAIQAEPAQSTRYMLGLQGYFLYWLAQIRTNASASDTVATFTSADVAAAVRPFGEYPTFTPTGTLFAGPDFDFLAPGATGFRRRWDQSRDGSGQARTTGYAENDFTFNASTLNFDTVYNRGGLVSVTVPAANASQVSASAQGTTITYQALPGFSGTTYFDYVISDERGQQASARFYLIVR